MFSRKPDPRAQPSLFGTIMRWLFRLLVVASACSLLWIAWWLVATPSYDALERQLIEVAGIDPLRDIAPVEANQAALAIEALAAPLGIQIAPQGFEHRASPSREVAVSFSDVQTKGGELLLALMKDGTAEVELPEEVESFLVTHGPVLVEIRDLLQTSDPSEAPRWELDFRQGGSFQLPFLLGHLYLHELLLLRALTAEEAQEAVSWVDAAARLRRGLEGQLAMIFLLIHQSELRHEMAVLRRLDVWPTGLRQDLEGLLANRTLAEHALTGYRLETWLIFRMMRNGEMQDPGHPAYLRFVTERLGRHGIRHQLIATEKMIEPILANGPVGFDPEEQFERGMATIPEWSLMARILTPHVSDVFIKTARTELDIELTLRSAAAQDALVTTQCTNFEPRQPSVIDGVEWLYGCDDQALVIEPTQTFDGSVTGAPVLSRFTVTPRG